MLLKTKRIKDVIPTLCPVPVNQKVLTNPSRRGGLFLVTPTLLWET
jgi:hypothetical protein